MRENYGVRVWRDCLNGLEDSATTRVLSDPKRSQVIEQATTTLEAWYPGLEARMNNHKWQFSQCAVDVITEFAINLGSFGAITVLTGNDLWSKWRSEQRKR